ncbi:tail assembly chaperone [Arthrobacter phage Liebe]|uniref:Tail assembly chaperone n=2 Tax=Arthrobacter virus Liebe TaxID=2734245 RepID=A0A3G2KHP0_9CAUD|nr:tail assembly chaperone [Arthrobacter phage Liebe]AYN58495.1 tail assembly chaperone [Arthrobacter phage Maureen]AZF93747.1 tail assembly chaperone [Arthrobacter phage Liebe]
MTTKKTPAAAEALAEKIPFTFDGVDYEIDPTSEWPYEVLEAYESGRITVFLALILGDAQIAKYKATKPKVAEVDKFVLAIQKALGIAGKLTALAALIRESPDTLEADLQRFYSVDLGDLWRGGLSVRRLSVLVHALPPESATARKYDTSGGWSRLEYLVADVFHGLTGEAHPSRPKATGSRYSDLRARLEEQKARLGKN